jgi:uncharacterized repeat protein (TIGR03803 family)
VDVRDPGNDDGAGPDNAEVVLHNFGSTTGAYPVVGVIGDSAGNLYGTATVGGTSGQGVVYKLDTAGQYSVLYNFTGGADVGDSLLRGDPRPVRQPLPDNYAGGTNNVSIMVSI